MGRTVKKSGSKVKRNNKINKKLRILVWLLILAASGWFLWIVTVGSSGNYDKYLLEYGEINIEANVMGLVVRDEFSVPSPNHGNVLIKASEGKRVARNERVLMLYQLDEIGRVQQRIDEVDRKIHNYINSTNIIDEIINHDIEVLDARIAELEETLNSLPEEDSGDADKIKEKIQKLYDQRIDIVSKSKYESDYLKELLHEKEKLVEQGDSNVTYLYAAKAGIISYIIDGYEDILKPDSIDSFNVFDINNIISSHGLRTDDDKPVNLPEFAVGGEPVYKIIDNFDWYFTFVCDNKDVYFVKEGDRVQFTLEHDESTSINARVYNIRRELEESVVILRIVTEVQQALENRALKIKILFRQYSGLKSPLSAIVLKEDKQGIYIIESGRPVFRTIKIIGKDEKYAIIEGKERRIRPYSNVVLNPENIEQLVLE